MRSCRVRDGIAAVELALVLPLLLTLLVGTWEVGRLIEMNNAVVNAAREGARAAASAKHDDAACREIALTYLRNNNIPIANATVDIENMTKSGDVGDADQLDKVRCTVTLPIADVAWIMLDFFVDRNSNVRAAVDWRSMADVPLAVDPVLPVE